MRMGFSSLNLESRPGLLQPVPGSSPTGAGLVREL
jgi:hypothetical protein